MTRDTHSYSSRFCRINYSAGDVGLIKPRWLITAELPADFVVITNTAATTFHSPRCCSEGRGCSNIISPVLSLQNRWDNITPLCDFWQGLQPSARPMSSYRHTLMHVMLHAEGTFVTSELQIVCCFIVSISFSVHHWSQLINPWTEATLLKGF